MARTERIVLVAVALPFAGLGSLPYAMYLLAALTAFTVVQRVDLFASNSTRRIDHGRSGHDQRLQRTQEGSGKVRVAIVGVGNCASSLVQGSRTTTATPSRTSSCPA